MHLAYDKGNQLVQVTVQEQGKHITQSYRYDAFGRRLAKYNDPGSSQTSKGTAEESGTDYFGWDGDRLVHTERLGSGNAKNDTDTPQPEVIHTVYEPGSFTPLVQLRRAAKAEPDLADELIAHMQPGIAQDALRGMFADIGATNALINAGLGNLGMAVDAQDFIREQLKGFEETVNSQREENAKSVEVRHYLCDHLGTPNALVSNRGQIEWAAMVDVWGNVKEEHNPKELYQPIRLPGQHIDLRTTLHYNRHRYYEGMLGSYTSDDPIGLRGGFSKKTNAKSNPIQLIDVLGLKWKVDPLGRSPQSLGGGTNTIFCDGEAPKIAVQELNHEACQSIKKCTAEHESSHLDDALKENNDVCKGNSGSVIIVNDNDSDRLKSEQRAFAKEIECLEKESQATSISSCKSRSNSKKAGVEWQLKNKILKGTYP